MLNFYFRTYKLQMIAIIGLWIGLIISSLIISFTLVNNDTINAVVSYNAEYNSYSYTTSYVEGNFMATTSEFYWFFKLVSFNSIIKYCLIAFLSIFTFYVTTNTRWTSDQLIVGKNEQVCNLITIITFPLVTVSIFSLLLMNIVKEVLGAGSIYTISLIYLLVVIALLTFSRYKLIDSYGLNKYQDNPKLAIISVVSVIVFAIISLILNLLQIGIIPLLASIVTIIWLILNIRKTTRYTVGI